MCHVLIIEDEWLIADHLAYLAGQAGATSIATALTEEDAVASANTQPPNIILSDVHLLEGTGPHAVRTIISNHGAIPVIFITATPEDCQPFEAPNVVITKPVDPARMIKAFKQLAPSDPCPGR